jgi:hypothetical protein
MSCKIFENLVIMYGMSSFRECQLDWKKKSGRYCRSKSELALEVFRNLLREIRTYPKSKACTGKEEWSLRWLYYLVKQKKLQMTSNWSTGNP